MAPARAVDLKLYHLLRPVSCACFRETRLSPVSSVFTDVPEIPPPLEFVPLTDIVRGLSMTV